jgi:alkylhydroperoxidase/carboxymuconolactone decarboxylase family protein YurZ
LHVAHYSGFPTGVSANQILNEIISDLEKEK